MFGYAKGEVVGKTSKEFDLWVNPDDWNALYQIYIKDGEINHQEALVKSKSGEQFTCLISGNIFRLKDRDYLFTFYQDITMRKEAEEALRISELKYREIFNAVSDAIMVNDFETGFLVDANRKTCEMFKYTIDELKGFDSQMLGAVILPYHFKEIQKIFSEFEGLNSSDLIEWEAKDKDGKIFWVDLNFIKIYFDNKYRIISVIRDITERKKAESLLVENEFLFRTQFNNSSIGITISDSKKKIIRANKKFFDITGFCEEELQGKSWTEITHADDIENELSLFYQIQSGALDYYEMDKRYVTKSGGTVYTHISVSCFRDPDNSIRYIIAYVLDLSDRLEMENKIFKAIIETEESERARFAQELHDGLGPILSSIKMYIQWMAKPNANLDQPEALKHMENLIGLAHQSVREVALGLSPHVLKDFGLIEAINSFLDNIKGKEAPRVIINSNLTTRFDETVETTIYRILIECINNSLKHAQAGLIKIDLLKQESILKIDYSDDGVGFLQNDINDKKGMGFYNIQNRLKSINGSLTINSQLGKGTNIKILINL